MRGGGGFVLGEGGQYSTATSYCSSCYMYN